MAINFHGDELHPMQSGELGASLDARAISHLEEVSEEGVVAMAEKKVTAVLLPTTAYILKLKPPPARSMIEKGRINVWCVESPSKGFILEPLIPGHIFLSKLL